MVRPKIKKKKKIGMDLENKFMTAGRGPGERRLREFGMETHTLLYLKWIASKDLLYSTGHSAPCEVAACMGWGWGEWIHVCVAESLCVHLKLSQHCSLAIPQYKIKSNKKFRKKMGKWG